MLVNNRETREGDVVNYVDQARIIHKGVITAIAEQDGNHFAEIEYEKDGQKTRVTWAAHNTSPKAHSWNHTQH